MATTNRADPTADSPRAASESIALRWAGTGVLVGMVGGLIGGGAVALAMTRHESAPLPTAAAAGPDTPAIERSPALLPRPDAPPEPPAPVAWLPLGEPEEPAPVAARPPEAFELPVEQPAPLVLDEPPPPAPVEDEAPPPRPFDDAEWSDGWYGWEGDSWVWHGGSWMSPPDPGDTIAPAYLESRDEAVIYVAPFWQRPGTSFVPPRLGTPLPAPLHRAMSSPPSSGRAAIARGPSWEMSNPPAHLPASPVISTSRPPTSAPLERHRDPLEERRRVGQRAQEERQLAEQHEQEERQLAEQHEQEERQLAELQAFQARQQAELEARERAEQEAAAHRTAAASPTLRPAIVTARRRR